MNFDKQVNDAYLCIIYTCKQYQMRDNRPFSEKEDEIIRDMYENQNIKKWSMIARAPTQEYNFSRNAKQCRDRYHRYLDPMMVSEWTYEEQQKLYELHNEIGNKWAVIAQKFPGRTDNSVKNHFYSKLRKSLRHLNKVIKQNFRKQFKELKIGSIYKIIEALEDRFNERTAIDQDVFNKCISNLFASQVLKRELLQYSNQQNDYESGNFEKERQLIREINQFSRSYKRKTKKQRRNSLNGADLFKPATLQKRIKYSSDQQSSQSEYSQRYESENENDNESQQSQVDLGVIQQDIRQSLASKFSAAQKEIHKSQDPAKNQLRTSQKSQVQIQVEQVLRGFIEQGQIFMCKPEISFCSVSIRSESQRHDMFDDNLRISDKLRQVQQMQEQQPQNSIFRSHR